MLLIYYYSMFQIHLKRHFQAKDLLLSKFLLPETVDHFQNDSNWQVVLGEDPATTINNFIKNGLISEGNIYHKMDHYLNIYDLRERLRYENLKLSGNKTVQINRLLERKSDELEREFSQRKVFICTEKGSFVANQYKNELKKNREKLEESLLGLLIEKDFQKAVEVKCTYEINSVFPESMNYEYWEIGEGRLYKSTTFILNTIFSCKPIILNNIEPSDLEILRLFIGLRTLLGGAKPTMISMPKDFDSKYRLKTKEALWSLAFYVGYKFSMQYEESPRMMKVRIQTNNDSCNECRELEERIYTIEDVIELPNKKCTKKDGCKCSYIFPDMIYSQQHEKEKENKYIDKAKKLEAKIFNGNNLMKRLSD
jgi:hypothetical protein